MKIKSLFVKLIDRPIEGVIKADDDTMLRHELDEYVLTNEIQECMESFLEMYNDPVGVNGAWLSGFFGSGKSHLLKILALILENREIEGEKALEIFLPKLDEIDNVLLKSGLERAVQIPSKSVLFNIDQRADAINKTDTDALLSVFYRVFNEMRGYYGKHSYVAQFERDLDERSLLQDFQNAFHRVSGQNWLKEREAVILVSHFIDRAYAEITDQDPDDVNNILKAYRETHSLSIDDFANEIKDYIDRQGPNFRLNFFVDEVGQFIANQAKLMTNLQTIAESLATICEGRSWIVVTSQSDMETVVGGLSKPSENFSKIRDRFKVSLSLTSINVAEVIKKRLLDKKREGQKALERLYIEHMDNFGTLFTFSGGSRSFPIYQNREEFIETYPFVPYQFDLFQLAIEKLSFHDAFEGRYRSVGERSMLAVFQEVTKNIAALELGQLATFDQMFEGIKDAIKPQVRSSMTAAERQLGRSGHVFELRLLKALFLVKYVGEFKATINNLAILMLPHFDENIVELRASVEESLTYLEQQTYVRRHGDIFEYLTDEEKDIEREIKATEINIVEITKVMTSLIFDSVITTKKIRSDTTGHDYPYWQKLDGISSHREQELTINFISPFNDFIDDLSQLHTNSSGRNEMLVIMPPEHRLIHELRAYKQTEIYINQNYSNDLPQSVKIILNEKEARNQERYKSLKRMVHNLIVESAIYIEGNEIISSSEDPKTRIDTAFQSLISSVYPNLRMIQGTTYTLSTLSNTFDDYRNYSVINGAMPLPEVEQEILSFVSLRTGEGQRISVRDVLEHFGKRPYGWYEAATLNILARLCARGKLEATNGQRGDYHVIDRLPRLLLDSTAHNTITLEPQIEFAASELRQVKEYFENYFQQPLTANEAKALGLEIQDHFGKLNDRLELAFGRKNSFPFVEMMSDSKGRIENILDKSYKWYIAEFSDESANWLQEKEELIDPILSFIESPRGEIYLEARSYLMANTNNFDYLYDQHDVDILRSLVDDPECFKQDTMQVVKEKLDSLSQDVTTKLEEERGGAIAEAKTFWDGIEANTDYRALPDQEKEKIAAPFHEIQNRIKAELSIPAIRELSRRFKEHEIISTQNKILEMATASTFQDEVQLTPQRRYISSKNIPILYSKVTVEDMQDLDNYINAMRKAWNKALEDGKKIQLS